MHSYVYNYAPTAFVNTWINNENRNINYQLHNTNNDNLTVPYARIELFKKSPLYSLPTIWNELDHLKYQHNRFTFKWSLKCKYFDNWNVDLRNLPLN